MDQLVAYPYVVVRLACRFCPRKGAYRLARLAEKFGSHATWDTVVTLLTKDCALRGMHPGVGTCQAYLPDVAAPGPPPDLPPAMRKLKLIEGGRK